MQVNSVCIYCRDWRVVGWFWGKQTGREKTHSEQIHVSHPYSGLCVMVSKGWILQTRKRFYCLPCKEAKGGASWFEYRDTWNIYIICCRSQYLKTLRYYQTSYKYCNQKNRRNVWNNCEQVCMCSSVLLLLSWCRSFVSPMQYKLLDNKQAKNVKEQNSHAFLQSSKTTWGGKKDTKWPQQMQQSSVVWGKCIFVRLVTII